MHSQVTAGPIPKKRSAGQLQFGLKQATALPRIWRLSALALWEPTNAQEQFSDCAIAGRRE
jgi:hypothetical protein